MKLSTTHRKLNPYVLPGLKNNVFPIIDDFLVKDAKLHIKPEVEAGYRIGTFEVIEQEVCQRLFLSRDEIRVKTRKGEVVIARQIIMFMMWHTTIRSLAYIASLYKMNHATVSHAKKTINNYIETGDMHGNIAAELIKPYKIVRQ